MKIAILIMAILILFGILFAIHMYEASENMTKEPFGVIEPMISSKRVYISSINHLRYVEEKDIILSDNRRFWYMKFSGNDWFHVNNLLFFDTNGKLLELGKDLWVGSEDSQGRWNIPGWWGDASPTVVYNPQFKMNTYWHSVDTNSKFYMGIWNTDNVQLGKIYMRNRFTGPNSGQRFGFGSYGVNARIYNITMTFYDVDRQIIATHKIRESALTEAGFNIVYNIKSNIAEVDKAAKEKKRLDDEAIRKKKLADEATAAAKALAERNAEIAAQKARDAERARLARVKTINDIAFEFKNFNDQAIIAKTNIKTGFDNIQTMDMNIQTLQGHINIYNKTKIDYKNDGISPQYNNAPSTDLDQVKSSFQSIVNETNQMIQMLNIPNQGNLTNILNQAKSNIDNNMSNNEQKIKIITDALNDLKFMNVPDVVVNYREYNNFISGYNIFIKITKDVQNKVPALNEILTKYKADVPPGTNDAVKQNIDNVLITLFTDVKNYKIAVETKFVPNIKTVWKNITQIIPISVSNYANSVAAYRIKTKILNKSTEKRKEVNDMYKNVTTTDVGQINPYSIEIVNTGSNY